MVAASETCTRDQPNSAWIGRTNTPNASTAMVLGPKVRPTTAARVVAIPCRLLRAVATATSSAAAPRLDMVSSPGLSRPVSLVGRRSGNPGAVLVFGRVAEDDTE